MRICVGILILLAVIANVSNATKIEPDDLIRFMLKYLEELKFTDDVGKYMKCVDKSIGDGWEEMVKEIGETKWEDPIQILRAFSAFMQPALISIGEMTNCGREEIEQLCKKIADLLKDEKAFAMKVMQNADIISQVGQEFIENWAGKHYEPAGKVAGAVIFWVFFN